MNTLLIEKALASIEQVNPHQVIATFIFADDKPNSNHQGLPFSEFEQVAKSAIGMPIKMLFTGNDIGNHEGSIPIGVIQDMEIKTISDDYHQLIAKAALWVGEYPDEVAWLKQAFAEGRAPGISYEINYKEAEIIDNVEWLKETFTGAATFVRTPAYGTRTALIALASTKNTEELTRGIIALAEQLSKPKGGNQMDEEALKAELETLKAEAATKQSEIEALTTQLSEKDAEILSLKETNEGLVKSALIDNRLRDYTSAGFTLEAEAEKVDKRKNLFASFNDEQWAEYLADLVAAKAAAAPAAGGAAHASKRNGDIPKPDTLDGLTDIQTLRQGLRTLARPNQID